MAQCDRIYAIVQEPPRIWLPKNAPPSLDVVNAFALYEEGAVRSDNYERVTKTILGAFQAANNVGYVTYGNPLAYDSVAQSLVLSAPRQGIDTIVVPGISSIDTLLCDLRTDMAPGIQVFEASWAVAANIQLDVGTAAILLQLGTFGSLRAHYRDRRPAESLAGLMNYLAARYGPDHRVALVQSSGGPRSARIRHVEIRNLCDVAISDYLAASMYIPPLRPAGVDEEIVRKMKSV
jgi:uncharacterized protein YabN with tetrapyrrole methylase and pyrophosphatase domain